MMPLEENMVSDFCKYLFSFQYSILLIIDDQAGETNPEMICVLLQTAASDLERSTEVCCNLIFYIKIMFLPVVPY